MPTNPNTRNLKASRQAKTDLYRKQVDNEAKAWSQLPELDPALHKKSRYLTQEEMLDKAVSGDIEKARSVLHYLSSSNQDLRRMMQSALHDHRDPKIWRYLLNFLAMETWEDAFWQVGLAEPPGERAMVELDCAKVKQSISSEAINECLHSIIEVFAVDESPEETQLKKSLLQKILLNSGEKGISLPPKQSQRRLLARYAAAYISGLRSDPEVIPVLEELVEQASLTWKLRAVRALGVMQDERCCPGLLKALTLDIYPLHQEASRTLNSMGSLARSCWEQALEHPNSHVRWHAARGLGQIGDSRAIEVLAEGLYDDNQAVRWATARVLASLDSTAIPAILEVLTHHRLSEPFRQAVYHALHAMPAHMTQEYLKPLLEALHSPAANVEAPSVAQRMLLSWGSRRFDKNEK